MRFYNFEGAKKYPQKSDVGSKTSPNCSEFGSSLYMLSCNASILDESGIVFE